MRIGKQAVFVILVFSVFLAKETAFGELPPLWGELKPGPYAVGFEVLFQTDPSRPYKHKTDFEGKAFKGSRSRPLQISIWYPAAASGPTAMTFADYVSLTSTEESGGEVTAARREQALQAFRSSRWSQGADGARLQQVLDARMAAASGAPAVSGRFPLVVVAQSISMSHPYGNSVLCEYLASYGYVVASTPGIGSSTRLLDFESAETMVQYQDMQHVIRALNGRPNVDPDRLALIGFSFGALGGSLLAMHNTDVDAFVSLCGSQGDLLGYSVLFQNPLYEPSRMRIPVLQLTVLPESSGSSDIYFKALKYSDITTVKIQGSLTDVSTLGAIAGQVPKFAGAGENPEMTHRVAVRTIQEFLDANVKKDPDARGFLESFPGSAGIPEDFARMEIDRGFPSPPTEQEFIRIVNEQGVAAAALVFRAVKSRDPEFNIFDPDNLQAAADDLIRRKKAAEAVELMKLNVEAFPSAPEVYDYLGRAALASGNSTLAIESFRKSLELDPDNEDVRQRLEKLNPS